MGKLQGAAIFSDYQKRFCFGVKTRIDLPGEESCAALVKDETMGAADLATNTFGQNYNVTMIQLAAAFSASINGGYYYQPHVVKRVVNENGGIVETYDKTLVKQVITKETSDIIECGSSGIVSERGRTYACHKEENGRVHMISHRCTHMGCEVVWNKDEKSWDCPCHGSRYDVNGRVLDGPARKDISGIM
jgi:Rieske Fe-S protein